MRIKLEKYLSAFVLLPEFSKVKLVRPQAPAVDLDETTDPKARFKHAREWFRKALGTRDVDRFQIGQISCSIAPYSFGIMVAALTDDAFRHQGTSGTEAVEVQLEADGYLWIRNAVDDASTASRKIRGGLARKRDGLSLATVGGFFARVNQIHRPDQERPMRLRVETGGAGAGATGCGSVSLGIPLLAEPLGAGSPVQESGNGATS
jgi:hypothetical protein